MGNSLSWRTPLREVCPQCGAKVVNAEIGEQIAKLIRNSEQIAKSPRISVPLVHYQGTE